MDVAARGCLEVIKKIADCAPFANVKGYQGLCEFDIRANIPAQVAYDLYKAQCKFDLDWDGAISVLSLTCLTLNRRRSLC